MSTYAVRFFAATAVALSLFVLTQGVAPRVEAGAEATFSPDPLEILDGSSGRLTVTVEKEVTQGEIDAGVIDVELVEPGGIDNEFLAKNATVPTGTVAGETITITVMFVIKCVDNEIEDTGEESIEVMVEFESTDFNATGSGLVVCSGAAIVTFDPDPLEVPEGSTRKVTVTVTKLASLPEVNNKKVHLRLIQPGGGTFGGDVLLDTADVRAPGAGKLKRKITVTTTFPIDCTNNEIRGKLAGTGTDDAELSIELIKDGANFGMGQAFCVAEDVSQVPSSGSHPSSIVVDEASGFALVLNAFDGAIGVFDGAVLIDTINLPCVAAPGAVSNVEPDGSFNCLYQGLHVLFTPVGPVFYVTDHQTGLVISIFIGFLFPFPSGTPEITAIPVGGGPTGIGGDQSSGQLYVANNTDGTVSVIDSETNTVTETITVGGGPNGVVVDSVNAVAYVSNFTLDVVHVIDTATNTEVATIPVGNGPDGMEIDHDTGTLWVTNFIDGTVTVVDLYTSPLAVSSLPTTIDLGAGTGPNDISLNMYTNRLYTANALNDTASVINRTTRQLVATIDVGDTPDAVAAHGKKGIIYVANHGGDSLSLISDPNPFVKRPWGDLNCSGLANVDDVLASLRATDGLPGQASNGCPASGQGVDVLPFAFGHQSWGDLNCDGQLDGHDPLRLILVLAGVSVPDGGSGCPDVHEMTYVW